MSPNKQEQGDVRGVKCKDDGRGELQRAFPEERVKGNDGSCQTEYGR